MYVCMWVEEIHAGRVGGEAVRVGQGGGVFVLPPSVRPSEEGGRRCRGVEIEQASKQAGSFMRGRLKVLKGGRGGAPARPRIARVVIVAIGGVALGAVVVVVLWTSGKWYQASLASRVFSVFPTKKGKGGIHCSICSGALKDTNNNM